MTYCVAMRLRAGLLFASDSRTNAGVDHIATFRKMNVFESPGDRTMVLMGSGVPALIFFMAIVIRALQELLTGVRRHRPWTEPMLLRIAVAMAVIGFIVRNLFDYMFAGSLLTLFWIVVATGLSVPNGARSEK